MTQVVYDLVYDDGKLRSAIAEDNFPEWSDDAQTFANFILQDDGLGWAIYCSSCGGEWVLSYGDLIQRILIRDPLVIIDLHFKLSATDLSGVIGDSDSLAHLIAKVKECLPEKERLISRRRT
jgi:hypothetical protein